MTETCTLGEHWVKMGFLSLGESDCHNPPEIVKGDKGSPLWPLEGATLPVQPLELKQGTSLQLKFLGC